MRDTLNTHRVSANTAVPSAYEIASKTGVPDKRTSRSSHLNQIPLRLTDKASEMAIRQRLIHTDCGQ